jgi:hypothetical protein
MKMDTLYKNVRPVARTLSEATRDADYATPIWKCESENVSAMRLLGFLVGVLGICLLGGLIAVTFLAWVGVIGW